MVQNRNYYHTCPACRINIFNADFHIFLYNQAGNKTDEFFFFLSFFLSFLRLNVPSESCNLFLKAGNIWRVCIYCPFYLFSFSKQVNCAWDGVAYILSLSKQAVCYRWLVHCPFLLLFSKSISFCKQAIYKTLHLFFSPFTLPLSLSVTHKRKSKSCTLPLPSPPPAYFSHSYSRRLDAAKKSSLYFSLLSL